MFKRKLDKSPIKAEEEDLDFEPKLTRSKAKKLLETQANIVWPITPIRKLAESDLDFINEEFPEESDDEEYKPSIDDLQDQSEEESGRHSVVSTASHNSTLDLSVSQYLESFDANLLEASPVKCPDDLFKIPSENIGQRTRSKLCLSDTPLEAIEKAFVPPDITTDMYNFKCDNEDWENFLKEFMQPLSNDLDDDDEADPEYNALADEEEMYKEELRQDRAVKISRKELRKLMAELLECPDELSSDEEKEREIKTETTNKVTEETTCEHDIVVTQDEDEEDQQNDTFMTKNQILLLQQQLRQHVQLTTQHFLQTCQHPMYGNYAKDFKTILASLLELAKTNSNSMFNIYNLQPAFTLIENWEKYLLGKDGPAVIDHFKKEIEMSRKAKKKYNYHRINFHPRLLKLISESDVFLYSLLLPPTGFRCDGPLKMEFVTPEDSLIALGLDQFMQHLKKNPRWFDKFKYTEKAACELICEHLMPVKTPNQLTRHIREVKGNESNPINYYRQYRKAPRTVHYLIPFNNYLKQPPCRRRKEILPQIFRDFIFGEREEGGNKENDGASTEEAQKSATDKKGHAFHQPKNNL
ncbi:hypothetical protein RUM43_005120 [Polyplax serrata]|uniref:GON-4-like protein n=1 Tax=Polyplax serrata TaxID=468196 RepID=A0AAN8SF69_POLSC